ncbi:hypothetical protein CL614_01990 [archaeon]|nr:hypothetical protein [archaeon]|tara:strand:- start:1569 stop:2015 length:447 start_codon:yes stop_codon:yes gene_type:complete
MSAKKKELTHKEKTDILNKEFKELIEEMGKHPAGSREYLLAISMRGITGDYNDGNIGSETMLSAFQKRFKKDLNTKKYVKDMVSYLKDLDKRSKNGELKYITFYISMRALAGSKYIKYYVEEATKLNIDITETETYGFGKTTAEKAGF